MFERMRRRREFPIIISSRFAREMYFEYSLRYGNRVAFSKLRFQLLVIVCRYACLNYFLCLNLLRLTRPPVLRVKHV